MYLFFYFPPSAVRRPPSASAVRFHILQTPRERALKIKNKACFKRRAKLARL